MQSKLLRRITQTWEMYHDRLTCANCDHKEAIVTKVLMNAYQKTPLLTLHFTVTHWQPVLILVNNPVKIFILMMIYSSISFVVSARPCSQK